MKKRVRLPDRQEILDRLSTVDDDPFFTENFYPIIAKYEKRELDATGILIMFVMNIHEFCKDYPSISNDILYNMLPNFADALIDDKKVKKEVKRKYREAIEAIEGNRQEEH